MAKNRIQSELHYNGGRFMVKSRKPVILEF